MTELSEQIDACKARRQRFADAETRYANKGRTEADIQQAVILENVMSPGMLPPIPQAQFAAAAEIAFPTIVMNKIEAIQRAVLREFPGITTNDLKSIRKTANCVRPRQIAMYLAKEMTGSSSPAIGRRFGNRDHSTVLHAIRKINNEVTNNPDFAALVARIKESVPEVGI